jgi:hypothetical protein
MPLTSQEISDLQRDFSGTIIHKTSGKDSQIFRVRDITEESGSAIFYLQPLVVSPDGKMLWGVNYIKERHDVLLSNVSRIFPKMGYVNLEGYCLLLTRAPHRQWRTHYNSKVVRTYSPSTSILKKLGRGIYLPDSPYVVFNLFNRDFPRPDVAWNAVMCGDTLSIAVSRKLAVVSKLDLRCPVLYYRQTTLGALIDDRTAVLSSKHKSWIEYVREFYPESFIKV